MRTRFISCDWGTSRLRIRLVETSSGRILAEHASDEGIQRVASAGPDGAPRRARLGAALAHAIAALAVPVEADVPVVMSGMASSTLGWQVLPYAPLPAAIDGRTLHCVDFDEAGRRVRLISGLRSPSDVMRGEETELVGLFSAPGRRALAENSLALLPGSHSKHVRLAGGCIVDFTTHLTGELFGLLAAHSTLAGGTDASFDPDAFLAGVRANESLGLTAALFQTRARVVLGHLAASHSRSFLSGALIGAELSGVRGEAERPVVLAAGGNLAREYAIALRELLPDARVTLIPPDELTAAVVRGHGLVQARA